MGGISLSIISWAAILLYMCIIIFFVVRGAIQTKNISDYAVGSMNFSPIAVGLALAASITSAATFIINPGFVALYGFSSFLSFGIIKSTNTIQSNKSGKECRSRWSRII